MTFNLQTLLALSASVALGLTCVRSAEVGIVIMLIILPVSMMIIGVTSPQRGNQLDPSKRWYLFVIVKTWAFTLVVLTLLSLLFGAAPSLRDRTVRALNGDMRKYQLEVSFPGDRKTSVRLESKSLKLYDSK